MTRAVVLKGDCDVVLRKLGDGTVDALVTDPPGGIGYNAEDWDSVRDRAAFADVVGPGFAQAARTMKPGAYGLVWAYPRTSHWTALALEDRGGLEIRDVLHVFVKNGVFVSTSIAKLLKDRAARMETLGVGDVADRVRALAELLHEGGTGLKRSVEHWILVRKPSPIRLTDTAIEHGTGTMRVYADDVRAEWDGKLPSNLLLYQPKPTRAERDAGCDGVDPVNGAESLGRAPDSKGAKNYRAGAGRINDTIRNDHPTAKSIALMRLLVRLVSYPNGLVLDPFCGSGTTGIAAVLEGRRFVGAEQKERNAQIAASRVKAALRGEFDDEM